MDKEDNEESKPNIAMLNLSGVDLTQSEQLKEGSSLKSGWVWEEDEQIIEHEEIIDAGKVLNAVVSPIKNSDLTIFHEHDDHTYAAPCTLPEKNADAAQKSNKRRGKLHDKPEVGTGTECKDGTMEMPPHLKDIADDLARPQCRPDRLVCNCGYCTVRRQLTSEGHADNKWHREFCEYCLDKSKEFNPNLTPIIAVFEVKLATDNEDKKSVLLDFLEEMATEWTMELEDLEIAIAYIDDFPVEDPELLRHVRRFVIAIRRENVVAKMRRLVKSTGDPEMIKEVVPMAGEMIEDQTLCQYLGLGLFTHAISEDPDAAVFPETWKELLQVAEGDASDIDGNEDESELGSNDEKENGESEDNEEDIADKEQAKQGQKVVASQTSSKEGHEFGEQIVAKQAAGRHTVKEETGNESDQDIIWVEDVIKPTTRDGKPLKSILKRRSGN